MSNPCSDIDMRSVVASAMAGAVGGGASAAMIKGGAAAADAALISGSIAGGISMAGQASINYPEARARARAR
jgi:hypothetical protein